MQKPMVFIAGVLVGAVAVLTLSAVWAPARVDVTPVILANPPQAGVLPDLVNQAAPAGNGSEMSQPSRVYSATQQTSMQTTGTAVACPEPVEFTPAQLDELAEQRREQKYRQDLSNMHLSQPAAFEGKLITLKGDSRYGTNVDDFAKAEAGSDWAERTQRVLQQYFDTNQEEFLNVLVECRATICRIDGKARAAEVFDRYFSTPGSSFFPALGLSPFGVYPHVVPNDKDLGFVLFKYKNDDDFKTK